MYPIEKGIPLPVSAGGGRISDYPFSTMEVGDSFFVPFGDRKVKNLQNSLRTNAAQYQPKKFSIHTLEDAKGVRCWRIK
jgi:hypothetical protein